MIEATARANAAVILAVMVVAILAPTAAVAAAARPFNLGYLEIAGDARYEPIRRYTGLRLKQRHRPLAGAQVAIRDSRFAGRALGLAFALERGQAPDAAALMGRARALMAEQGVHFFLADAPVDALKLLARDLAGEPILLLNVSEPDDTLRGAACSANLLHVVPSRAMRMDALAQYLVFKGWRKVLVLQGPEPADQVLAAAFQRSARKFGAKVVAVKDFVLNNDPRERDRNNIALLTATPGHDVVFLADSVGEFGRYVPYQTQRPRPVVGTEGLIADAWHWTWERHGAPQLNQRFAKRAKRPMEGPDWAAWAAVKAVVEAVVRTGSTEFATVARYLKSDALTLDTYKGAAANFRPWNLQLRQPILLHTANAVVARAPLTGFLHPTNNLDTLGLDQPEAGCRF